MVLIDILNIHNWNHIFIYTFFSQSEVKSAQTPVSVGWLESQNYLYLPNSKEYCFSDFFLLVFFVTSMKLRSLRIFDQYQS